VLTNEYKQIHDLGRVEIKSMLRRFGSNSSFIHRNFKQNLKYSVPPLALGNFE